VQPVQVCERGVCGWLQQAFTTASIKPSWSLGLRVCQGWCVLLGMQRQQWQLPSATGHTLPQVLLAAGCVHVMTCVCAEGPCPVRIPWSPGRASAHHHFVPHTHTLTGSCELGAPYSGVLPEPPCA
jgi:hypothetical protein